MERKVRLRLGAQLAIVVAIPLVCLTVVTAVAFARFDAVRVTGEDVLAATTLRAKARDLMMQVIAERFANRGYFLDGKAKSLADAEQKRAAADEDLTYLKAHAALVPGLLDEVAKVETALKGVEERSVAMSGIAKKNRRTMIDAYGGKRGGAYDEAAALIAAQKVGNAELNDHLKAAVDLAGGRATAEQKSMTAQLAAAKIVSIVIGLLALALTVAGGTLFALYLRRRIARVNTALAEIVEHDVTAIGDVMDAIARGDMTAHTSVDRAPLPLVGSDEVTELTASCNTLLAGLVRLARDADTAVVRLGTVLEDVSTTAAAVSLASSQVSVAAGQSSSAIDHIATSVEKVAVEADSQSATIGEASAAIEELARAVGQVAIGANDQAIAVESAVGAVRVLDDEIGALVQHGRRLAQSAAEADAEAGAGTQAVGDTARAMRTLRERTTVAAEAIVTLEARSEEISTIVSAIDDIADQTNLLALNAAIEAARAGEHGRGFAVVADEVRKLAERASHSTREIDGILNAIRGETLSAAEAMRVSSASMNDGLALAERAAQALAVVTQAISATNAVAAELVARTDAMRATSVSLSGSIDSVSAVIGQNAAAANEMRLTTDEVARRTLPITLAAQSQARAAADASTATGEIAAGIQELDATARALSDQALRLRSAIETFTFGSTALPEAAPSRLPALAAG